MTSEDLQCYGSHHWGNGSFPNHPWAFCCLGAHVEGYVSAPWGFISLKYFHHIVIPWCECHTIQAKFPIGLVKQKTDLPWNNHDLFNCLLISLNFYYLVKILILFSSSNDAYSKLFWLHISSVKPLRKHTLTDTLKGVSSRMIRNPVRLTTKIQHHALHHWILIPKRQRN